MQPNSFVFIDEVHSMGKMAAEQLLILLEENVLHINVGRHSSVRLALPPHTVCAATTRPECLTAPLRQRFGLCFRFGFYSSAEIQQIIVGIFTRWQMHFDSEAVAALANHCRGVPRIALHLSGRVRDLAQTQRLSSVSLGTVTLAMRIEGLDAAGLRPEERQLLHALRDAEPRAVSARSLALALGVGTATVIEVLEPPLVRLGLMTIGVGGRRLTAKGRKHVETVAVQEGA